MSRLFLLVVMAASAASVVISNKDAAAKSQVTTNKAENFLLEKAFFGSYRTVTRTGVTLATTTVYATCLSGTHATQVCTGRKKRTVSTPDVMEEEDEER